MNPLDKLIEYGQSYWLDNLTRGLLESGELKRRIQTQGLRGVTSNPAIFHKAIAESNDYDAQIEQLVAEHRSISEIYEALVTTDIRNACDCLQPVYEASKGKDGFVSLEVSPHLAHDPEGSMEEAWRLWKLVNRPNLFIKIPGTAASLPAIEELLFEGININITLLFSVESYELVAEAYLGALERRLKVGQPIDRSASVASFFLSRIDTLVDQLLSHRLSAAGASGAGLQPQHLLGKAAVSNAKLAYQCLKRMLESERWRRLQAQGAQVQRLLWASTSTKNPAYRDVMYVEPLIGPHTVNTMPEATIAAFADHGRVGFTVEQGVGEAHQVMAALDKLGINFKQVTEQLEKEGIQKFIEPYEALMETLALKCQKYQNLHR